MATNEKVGHLEEEALKRKERLRALKRKLETTDEKTTVDESKENTLPKPKFRSYKPSDDVLKEFVVDDGKAGNVDEKVKAQLAAADQRQVIETLDVANLAPRKPDWDLKRDASKKLERLERRTQRAIAELIRERLRSEDGGDLAASVAIGAELQSVGDEE